MDWISPALLEKLLEALAPIDIYKTGIPQHEVLMNIGYSKAQRDFKDVLTIRHKLPLDPPV